LPSWPDTLHYAQTILDRSLARLRRQEPTASMAYFARLAAFHEDMHGEAFTYTRQTLAYGRPKIEVAGGSARGHEAGPLPDGGPVPGGTFLLGATRDIPFVFDNEKWAHPVQIALFAIARSAVTNSEFATFVDDGGYSRSDLWSPEGWRWREHADAHYPVYW